MDNWRSWVITVSTIENDGYIKIPQDGLYTFYLKSDDGSALSIDNKAIIFNDGLHAPEEISGNVVLKTGYHEINVIYFQGQGGMALDVSIEGPGLNKQIVPSKMLFQMKTK